MTVRTRFAPSPTGYLHIGGVRTALFNWLFARQHGGQFLLRIDDTDAERNVESALAPILHGFRWLGIDWDEGPEVGGPYEPYFQSKRSAQYQAAVKQLLASGHAYRDYAMTEEIGAERTAAEKEKRNFVYSRTWMAETDEQAAKFEAEEVNGKKRVGVVRLKMPREGTLVIPDLIRGNVEFNWATEQDHVIQRADGTCLYHLASVVDDYDFKITHVIRAEEHLSNTPRQIFIAQSLGYELPQYAHLPYVAEPGSKNKLSKRKLDKYLKNKDFANVNDHGQAIANSLGLPIAAETFNPVIVDFYEQVGYIPDAIINYLVLLGWSLDGTTEFFTRDEMIKHFSLERVNKAPASFDPKKLQAFQDHYMRQIPTKQKVPRVIDFLQRAGYVGKPVDCDMGPTIAKIVEAAGDRIKVFGDILNFTEFFVADEKLAYDQAAVEKAKANPNSKTLLAGFRDKIATVEPFAVAELEAALHQFVESAGIKTGELVAPMRLAISGKTVGMGLYDTLAILGRERSLKRMDALLKML